MTAKPTLLWCLLVFGVSILVSPATVHGAESDSSTVPVQGIGAILVDYCFGCHGDGASEGGMALDELLQLHDRPLAIERWYRVLRQVQAGLMPPADEVHPSQEERRQIANWIKYEAFGLDPLHPDPGHVTVRRLNQVEYRNSIRDLIGVDYDTSANFPADDTGDGFDNLGDVLSLSPLLLEKYVDAAKDIVSASVPTVSGILRRRSLAGHQFQLEDGDGSSLADPSPRAASPPGTLELSYYRDVTARADLQVPYDGDYDLRLNISARETYVDNQFDDNKCEFRFEVDGEELLRREFVRQGSIDFTFDFSRSLMAGRHELLAAIRPLSDAQQVRDLRIQLKSVDLIGPQQAAFHVKPDGYDRFFPRSVPESLDERREYARELLAGFATRAFRRPVEEESLNRLVELAESIYRDQQQTFEAGIAKSMTAVLASPRFLFREERVVDEPESAYPLLDEYSLATRLSYFLWSTMPDDELMQLAAEGTLRANLDGQVARMLADPKASALAENFVGQWLRSRAINTVPISSRAVLDREARTIDPDTDVRHQRFFELFRKGVHRTEQEEAEYQTARAAYLRSFDDGPRFTLTDQLRRSMRRETEMLFKYIVDDDRSLLELLDSDYTFLNETLWGHYQIAGIDPVEGDRMRLVRLPAGSPRGGVLTQGTVLVVTSNPDRTSPVKRGLFVLENLLGAPPPAPPPNIPALEDVEAEPGKTLTLRETLSIHRANELCSSCHNRMDPLGLALENFNALGLFRTDELGAPIDAAGTLATGESFTTVNELKKILVRDRKTDFYRCVTEKMMVFALGRAVEYTDAHIVDQLVDRLEATGGLASTLIYGVIHSDAFQRTRRAGVE